MKDTLGCLRALAEPTRLRLARLCAADDLTVSDLTDLLGSSQPGVSRHLKLLVEGGVLERFREGSWVFYRLARGGAQLAVVRAALDALAKDDPVLAADADRLRRLAQERSGRARAYFDTIAPDWDRMRALQADETVVDAEIKAIVLDRPVASLLDVGTGTGRMLALLGGAVGRAEGIDLSPEMLTLARERLQEAGLRQCLVRQADMEHLSGESRDFEVVIFHQVLHYSTRPGAAVRECARALKAGGRMVIVDYLPHAIEELRSAHNHARLGFATAEVAQWFADSGLGMVEAREVPGRSLTVGIWVGQKHNIPGGGR